MEIGGVVSIMEFKGLTKAYKDVVAVNNLTAGIEVGRITGFLGPNGAGKSTALLLGFQINVQLKFLI